MTKDLKKIIFGREGEQIAAEFLQKQGYKIIAGNFHTPYGEIDIIARDARQLVFVEIKTRGFRKPPVKARGKQSSKTVTFSRKGNREIFLYGAAFRSARSTKANVRRILTNVRKRAKMNERDMIIRRSALPVSPRT